MKLPEHKRLRVLICDQINIARGKYIAFDSVAQNLHFCKGVYAQGYDGNMLDISNSGLSDGFPDIEARYEQADIKHCWEDNTAVVVADLVDKDQAYALCARSCLKRAVAAWEDIGLTPKIGIELEAYLFEKDEQNNWIPYQAPASVVYGTGNLSDPAGINNAIWEKAKACGFNLKAIHAEYDQAQFEFVLEANTAIKAIDEAFLFRLMTIEVCHELGYKISYMPKPITERSGSGFHINFSTQNKESKNAFYKKTNEYSLTNIAKHSIAGLLTNHQALAALCAPTVNSYKRLRPASLSGYWANWGIDHRGVAVRVINHNETDTRLEYRLPDGSANPYLATAAMLFMALEGVNNSLRLPSIETGDGINQINANIACAENLGEALIHLQKNETLKQAIGETLIEHFIALKQNEYQRYLTATTDWESNEYFDYL